MSFASNRLVTADLHCGIGVVSRMDGCSMDDGSRGCTRGVIGAGVTFPHGPSDGGGFVPPVWVQPVLLVPVVVLFQRIIAEIFASLQFGSRRTILFSQILYRSI